MIGSTTKHLIGSGGLIVSVIFKLPGSGSKAEYQRKIVKKKWFIKFDIKISKRKREKIVSKFFFCKKNLWILMKRILKVLKLSLLLDYGSEVLQQLDNTRCSSIKYNAFQFRSTPCNQSSHPTHQYAEYTRGCVRLRH